MFDQLCAINMSSGKKNKELHIGVESHSDFVAPKNSKCTKPPLIDYWTFGWFLKLSIWFLIGRMDGIKTVDKSQGFCKV